MILTNTTIICVIRLKLYIERRRILLKGGAVCLCLHAIERDFFCSPYDRFLDNHKLDRPPLPKVTDLFVRKKNTNPSLMIRRFNFSRASSSQTKNVTQCIILRLYVFITRE